MWCYEISKEAFKQKLEERGNFFLFQVATDPSTEPSQAAILSTYKEVHLIASLTQLENQLKAATTNKEANLLFFSLVTGNKEVKKAAEMAKELGYAFCYYYQGVPGDILLDKGLN